MNTLISETNGARAIKFGDKVYYYCVIALYYFLVIIPIETEFIKEFGMACMLIRAVNLCSQLDQFIIYSHNKSIG